VQQQSRKKEKLRKTRGPPTLLYNYYIVSLHNHIQLDLTVLHIVAAAHKACWCNKTCHLLSCSMQRYVHHQV